MWKFLVKNQSIEILERAVLADHQIQYVQFRFTFDGDWRRFHKVVQFTQCDVLIQKHLKSKKKRVSRPTRLFYAFRRYYSAA